MLKFTRVSQGDREVLINLCRDIIHGTESYTYLMCMSSLEEEVFWCGRDEKGEIKTLIADFGDGSFPVFGEEIPEELSGEKRCTMIYKNSNTCNEEIPELNNSQIGEFYRLYSSVSDMAFDDKARYVYTLHCKNRGYCRFFGITENEKLISLAAVTSMNEKYALIGNVFTAENKRNRGLAEKCVRKCIDFSLSQGKIPFLYCNPHMINYYKRLGFELINE